jgi:hypothetical protein
MIRYVRQGRGQVITICGGRQHDARSAVPPVLLAAAVLAACDVSFVLVGSAALWLCGERLAVGDVDAVIEPGAPNLARLHAALLGLAVRRRSVPAVGRLAELPVASVDTSYGHLDCLLERGRLDWASLSRGADVITVADVPVWVAAVTDTWALRRRFGE